MTRTSSLLALTIMLGGCVTEASLLSNPVVPACSDGIPVVASPGELGCASLEIDGSDALACDYSFIPDGGPSPTLSGAWVRVRRAVDGPALLRVELVTPTCTDGSCGGPVHWHAGESCACGTGFERGWVEGSEGYSVRLPPGESAVVLPGADRRYRVSVCTLAPESWPTYPDCGFNGFMTTDDGGTCNPSCFDDADCPVPTSGTAAPSCNGWGESCSLRCDAGETCPDGQICVPFRGEVLCVVPHPPAP